MEKIKNNKGTCAYCISKQTVMTSLSATAISFVKSVLEGNVLITSGANNSSRIS